MLTRGEGRAGRRRGGESAGNGGRGQQGRGNRDRGRTGRLPRRWHGLLRLRDLQRGRLHTDVEQTLDLVNVRLRRRILIHLVTVTINACTTTDLWITLCSHNTPDRPYFHK